MEKTLWQFSHGGFFGKSRACGPSGKLIMSINWLSPISQEINWLCFLMTACSLTRSSTRINSKEHLISSNWYHTLHCWTGWLETPWVYTPLYQKRSFPICRNSVDMFCSPREYKKSMALSFPLLCLWLICSRISGKKYLQGHLFFRELSFIWVLI